MKQLQISNLFVISLVSKIVTARYSFRDQSDGLLLKQWNE